MTKGGIEALREMGRTAGRRQRRYRIRAICKRIQRAIPGDNAGIVVTVVEEGVETKAGTEAVLRAGKIPQLKGIIHEVLFKDRFNFSPRNILCGRKAFLTCPNDPLADVVIIQNGNVIRQIQLKDAPKAVDHVIHQVSCGKYDNVELMGTNETVKVYMKKVGDNVKQIMTPTDISAADTQRIADKTLGKMPKIHLVVSAAGRAGVAGAAIGGAFEAIRSVRDLKNRRISRTEFAGRVMRASIKSGLSAAVGTVASSVGAAGTPVVLGMLGGTIGVAATPVWLPVTVGAATAIGASALASTSADMVVEAGLTYLTTKAKEAALKDGLVRAWDRFSRRSQDMVGSLGLHRHSE